MWMRGHQGLGRVRLQFGSSFSAAGFSRVWSSRPSHVELLCTGHTWRFTDKKSGSDCGGGGAVSRVLGPCILLNLPLLTSSDKEREDLPSGEFIAKGT